MIENSLDKHFKYIKEIISNLYHFMIKLVVSGGNKGYRAYIRRVIRFCIKELIPQVRSLKLYVKVKPLKEEYGSVTPSNHYNTFFIELHKKMQLKRLTLVTIHEMIHVKQSLKKEWTTRYNKAFWKGKDHTHTTYNKQPWEIQANKMEYKLYRKFKKINFLG